MVEFGSEYGLAEKTENGQKSCEILFVCTTNMFISPIAEAIFNENSQEKAVSAGLYGSFSSEMPFATIRTCQNNGLDVSDKRITHIFDMSMEDIGLVLAATCEIRDALKMQYPDLEIFTIRQYSGESHDLDIADPMGGPFEGYEKCFNEIRQAILKIIERRNGIVEKPVRMENFKYLDGLIHSGENEIVLDADIFLDRDEEQDYAYGIDLDAKELVIDGNGHTVNARNRAQIFNCKGKTTIKNITLKNGLSKSDGGAVINWRGNLTIVEATFIGNYAGDNGGAISNYGDVLNIIKSTFIKNSSQYQQSGEGGAIYNGRGDLNIAESNFIKNTANKGGSVYIMLLRLLI